MLLNEDDARELMAEYGRKLAETGLVQGTWGNISVRLDDRFMLCTPSGTDYARTMPEDMVKVDIELLRFEGAKKPTSEKDMHAAIYKARHDVTAIVHTHSKYCCVFAACEMPLQVEDPEMIKDIGDVIKCSDYALSGTPKLARNVVKALDYGKGCIISHHGMAAVGPDLETAFANCEKIEQAAERYINKRWEK
ncbi:MAG: class II aldolase/adducin family protein [Anaerovoracaceae bacterium]|jgi:L-fuculose-phosphate aldolase